MAWSRILVPHDFSACAQRALKLAAELARVHSARLVLVHVSDLPANIRPDALVTPPGSSTAMRIDEHILESSRERLERIAAPLRAEGQAVETRALLGDVAERILHAAEELEADVIAMGTHGRRGLSHLLVGSVAEKIVRHAAVPVLTIRSSEPDVDPTDEEQEAEDELSG